MGEGGRTGLDERRAERDDLVVVVERDVGNSVRHGHAMLEYSQHKAVTMGRLTTYNLLLHESVARDLARVTRLVEHAVGREAEMGVHEGHGSVLDALRRALRKRVIYAMTECLYTTSVFCLSISW